MTRALSGDWESDYESWRQRLEPFFTGRDSTDVHVLSWGPGEHSQYYAKRETIVADLHQHPASHVATSEQLIKSDERFKAYKTLEAEEIQAAEADIIILLVVDDPQATGAPTELTKFEDNPAVQPKIRLLRPRKLGKGLLHEASREFPDEQTYRYSAGQFQQCDDIRARCREWVEAVRRQKHLKQWREAGGRA